MARRSNWRRERGGMAITYPEEDSPSFDDESVRLSVLMNWAGALVSLALIAGLAVWGYQLLVRDVTGVPVVRALEGPMRVAPDDPGGAQAEYQELTVTQVASEGAEETPAESVKLAPRPLALAEEDRPMPDLLVSAIPAPRGLETGSAGEEDITGEIGTATEAATDVQSTPVAPTNAESVAAVAPDSAPTEGQDLTAAEKPKTAIEAAVAEALSDLGGESDRTSSGGTESALSGGVLRSTRPVPRPALIRAAVTASSTAEEATGEVSVDAIPAGTRLVQLGAFGSPEEARAAWSELDERFGDFFEGKKRVLQEAATGDSTFYRLRAMGFEDLSDARRFCAVLVAGSASCIPVIRR